MQGNRHIDIIRVFRIEETQKRFDIKIDTLDGKM